MLKLIEHTPARTIFEEKRTGLRVVAVSCLTISLFAMFAVGLQWHTASQAYPERVAEARVVLGTGVFALIILIFAAASFYALLLSRKMTLILDRDAGDIRLTAPRGLKMVTEHLPYYGVKSVRLTGGQEMRVLALVFVLRDSRVIPITAAPPHDREKLEALSAQIRDVLYG